MNVKRTFGVILTLLGIVGLIYAAILFMDTNGTQSQIKVLLVYGILGAIFFFTGIGLVKGTRDDAAPPYDNRQTGDRYTGDRYNTTGDRYTGDRKSV